MPSDSRIYVGLIAIIVTLIVAVSFVPPLTTGGVEVSSGAVREDIEVTVSGELQHCESLVDDLDCRCYAGVSGYVLAQERVPVPFTQTMNQTELARTQAAQSC
ncbi:MAG: hypothetical protein AAGK77_10610 [Pseudomonadota bacterium]